MEGDMKFRSTWILLILLAAMASYFFLVEERGRKKEKVEKEEKTRILPYSMEEVERFVFINPEGDTIEAEKVGSDWKITSPVITKGSNSAIETVLKQVIPGHKKEVLEGVSNLADFGLEHPFASLILYSKTKVTPDTIFVGDKTPTSSSCYVRLGSSRDIMICREMTHNIMNKNLYHLRDKNFLYFDREEIDAVKIKNGKNIIKLVKKGKFWWIEGAGYRADKNKVVPYLNRLTRAIIKEFVREDLKELKPYGLYRPEKMITLQRGAETVDISFGKKKDDKVYVTRSGLEKVMLLDDKMLECFDWDAKNLRAMNLAFYDMDMIHSVYYETPDTTCNFVRGADNKWKIVDNDSLEIKSYEVNSLLRKLSSIKFDKILVQPLPEFDERLENFYLRITLSDSKGNLIDKVTIARAKGDYQLGASMSANVIGKLKKDTDLRIADIFKRIGK